MITKFRNAKINKGQLRLLQLIASMYHVDSEEIINQLIKNYNELHLSTVLQKSVFQQPLGFSLGVVEVGDALSKKSDNEFKDSLKLIKNPSVKLAKEQQIQRLDEVIGDEIY
jgi:hypothetical protein